MHVLAEKIERCTVNRQNLERQLLFSALVLQRDKMVRKAKDIRPLLSSVGEGGGTLVGCFGSHLGISARSSSL